MLTLKTCRDNKVLFKLFCYTLANDEVIFKEKHFLVQLLKCDDLLLSP